MPYSTPTLMRWRVGWLWFMCIWARCGYTPTERVSRREGLAAAMFESVTQSSTACSRHGIASKTTSFGECDGSVGAGGRCTGIRIQPAERAAHTDDRGSRRGPSEVARRLRRVRRAQAARLARTVRKARLCRPCAAGAALSPGPAGLDRRTCMVRGTLHRRRGCCRPRLASSRPSGTRRCLLHDEKAPSRSAVMTPRDGALRADEVVASHSAADGAGASIEGARTYAHGISRGAVVAVSCVWSRATPFLSFLSFWSYELEPRPSRK
jgi:hypothetical protein